MNVHCVSLNVDRNLRLYSTTDGKFEPFKTIQARDVGWSVLDTAFSPDGNYIVYSSWSECRKYAFISYVVFKFVSIMQKRKLQCSNRERNTLSFNMK